MHILILATAAALAAPLPEGRGGYYPQPLEVRSDPPGATAFVRYRNSHGAEEQASCVTPCTLMIPNESPFIFEVEKDGRPFAKPPLAWRRPLIGPAKLLPASIEVRLP